MKNFLRDLKAWKTLLPLHQEWRRLSRVYSTKERSAAKPPKRVIIVPCDPWTFSGSKGDEAMIQAVLDRAREANPSVVAGAITATKTASCAATSMGCVPLEVWDEGLTACIESIIAFHADAVVVVGADCMDGYYSPYTSTRLLATGDISARAGINVTVTGFSFNAQPSHCLRYAFDKVDDRLSINVRDPISHNRFIRFTKARANLVADAAFMLLPQYSEKTENVQKWVALQRGTSARRVLGFNIHPMLVRNATDGDVDALCSSASKALSTFLKQQPDISCVLLSHDYRGKDGDDRCLEVVFDRLNNELGDRVLYPRERFTAGELKAIAGMMDAVVTGRMHLAIASLGMGVPVAVTTYQDKFQGLLQHFKFEEDLFITPTQLLGGDDFLALIGKLVNDCDGLKSHVDQLLPRVSKLSRINVSNLLAS